MLFHLPTELVSHVFEFLDSRDLVALSVTSAPCHPIAQRLLYRAITVTAANFGLVSTLAAKPERARSVKSFSLRMMDATVLTAFNRALTLALSNMHSLVSLELFLPTNASSLLHGAVLYPALDRFACGFPFDQNVAEFIRRCPSMRELETTSGEGVTVPPMAAPRLSHFVGTCQAACALAPGRPIERIYADDGVMTIADVECLSRSTANVAILAAETSIPAAQFLNALGNYLPSLVYLKLTTTHPFSQPPGHNFYSEIAQALTLLPDLVAFELSGMHWGSLKDGFWKSTPVIQTRVLEDSEDLEFYSNLFVAY